MIALLRRNKILITSGLLVLLLLLDCHYSRAQTFSYRHYTTRDGLAGSVAHGITQDAEGFLWFATETGLSRFDGRQFVNYTRKEGLPSNEVLQIFEDSRHRLWIGAFKNTICYYYKGYIHNQQNNRQLKSLTLSSPPRSISETYSGTILIDMAKNGTYAIPPDTNGQVIYIPWQSPYPQIYRQGQYDVKKGTPQAPVFELNDSMSALLSDSFQYLSLMRPWPHSKPYYLFLTTSKKICIIPEGDTSRRFFLNIPDMMISKPLNDTLLYISSLRSGVRFYNLRQRRFDPEIYLEQCRVNDVFRDREGNTWLSTNGAGIYQLNNSSFTNYTLDNEEHPVAINHIYRDKGLLTAIADNGQAWIFPVIKPQRMTAESVYHPVSVPSGINKVKSQPGVMVRYNNITFDNLAGQHSAQNLMLKTIVYTGDTFLVAAHSGAYRIKASSGRMLDTLIYSRATCAYQANNVIYIGTLDGLYIFNNGHLAYAGSRFPLLANSISSIIQGIDGTLWIGTYDEGVIGLKQNHVIAHLTESANRLSSNNCRCLYINGRNLWIGTDKGINKITFNGSTSYLTASRYDMSDGLPSDIINSLLIENHRVYAGTQAGITVFDETTIPRHGPCAILLTSITVSGKTTRYPTADLLQLPHKDNNIRFEFSGISFLSGSRMSYRYRLHGLQEDWRVTQEQSLDYPSLPSGEYTFEVKAVNKFGDESLPVQQYFVIKPLLWERKEAQLAAVLLLLLATCIIFQLRIQNIQKKDKEQQELKRKLMDLEQMALSAQMNPHFIFNCLNSIQHFVINSDARSANFYITRFAGLIRSTLENASRMYISLQEELAYLDSFLELERMQLSPAFRYTIDVASGINISSVGIPNMLLQPLVENAVKHGVSKLGEQGEIGIAISVNDTGNSIRCTITDNGPGINSIKSQTLPGHQSKGILITEERISILNRLAVNDQQIIIKKDWAYNDGDLNYGTRITITFPLRHI